MVAIKQEKFPNLTEEEIPSLGNRRAPNSTETQKELK